MAALTGVVKVALFIINVFCGILHRMDISCEHISSGNPPLQDYHSFNGFPFGYTRNISTFASQGVLHAMYCNQQPLQGKKKRTNQYHRACSWNSYLFTTSLLLSGDVEINPGPAKNLCGECGHTLRKNLKKFLKCQVCELTFHVRCTGIEDKDFLTIKNSQSLWSCSKCTLPQLSDSLFDVEFEEISEEPNNTKNFDLENIRLSLKKGLQVGLLNINRLLLHLDQLSTTMKTLGLNIIRVNETWLNSSVDTGEINIEGYNVIRHDRNANNSDKHSGGGVAIYIEDHIPYNVRPDLANTKLESTWIEVCFPKTSSILIGCIYRPPDSRNDFFDELEQMLSKVMSENKETYLLGDFNSNALNTNPLMTKLTEVTSELYLNQLINEPTRVTANSATCIDLIFTSIADKVIQSGVIQAGISDHYMPYFVRKSMMPKRPVKTAYVRNYKRYNSSAFLDYLQSIPWCVLEVFDDPQDMIETFVTLFNEAANKFAPMMLKRIKGLNNPWICPEIRKLMTERDILKSRAIKLKDTELYEQYKRLKNQITSKCRIAKQDYIRTLISKNLGDSSKMWKALKKVLPSSRQSTTMLQVGDETYTEPADIASAFNDFFSKIGSTLASKFPAGIQTQNLYQGFEGVFSFNAIPVNFTKKELCKLQASKSTGLDGINIRLLKDAADVVAGPLTHISNASLKTGRVPSLWKKARVTPIFKSDSALNPSNYRPISILPATMKIFERAVQQQLVSYFKDNEILCEEQSGFRQGHSTATATIHVTDYIFKNMDNGKLTGAAYLDLKKAFDTVDPETLLFKLQCIGIRGVEHTWFHNYLDERQQCVRFQNSLSSSATVTCGVPQGSILGPLLFIFFINDFKNCVTQCKLHMYADDTILMCSSKNVTDIKYDLEYDLQNAHKWFTNNKLHLNIAKCKFMLFGTDRRLQHIQPPDIILANENLEHVKHYKYLGLWMDSTLGWKYHLEKVRNKVKQRLGILRRVRHFVDRNLCLMLCNGLVLPLFDYCDIVYSNCNITEIVKLQRLQNRAAKLILQVPFDTNTHEVLSKLKWFYLTERLFYHRCIFMFNCFNFTSPDYLKRTFSVADHGHNTRSNSRRDLQIPRCRSGCGQKTFAYQGVKAWNSLTIATRSATTLNAFKNKLKLEILSKRGLY